MAIYTIHAPPPRPGEAAADPDSFVFVRDGFSFPAFLFGSLWMLRHRMWLVLAGYVLLIVPLVGMLRLFEVSAAVMVAVGVLIALLIGFEASSLRRFTFARRRWRSIGIAVGDDLESAERRFFHGWLSTSHHQPRTRTMPSSTSAGSMRPPSSEIIGLFPEPGASR